MGYVCTWAVAPVVGMADAVVHTDVVVALVVVALDAAADHVDAVVVVVVVVDDVIVVPAQGNDV